MKQMKIAEDRIIQLNYEDENLSIRVRELQPIVFEDGEGYYCLLGTDLETGIVGRGTTLKEVLANWESELERRIKAPREGDEAAVYASDMLQASNKKVW